MFLDADAELERIDPDVRHLPEVLGVRVEIYRNLEKWELMQAVAKKLAVDWDGEPHWWVCWAFATRRAESVEAARRILQVAFTNHSNSANIQYNLACYECKLGDLERAKFYLKQAFDLDKDLRSFVLEDEDLKPLKEKQCE
jgi:tetratricopeptide (TPR) repeat protein